MAKTLPQFAAIAAILALIGLYFYTRYTKQMMEMQEAIARASVTPILVTQGNVDFKPEEILDAPLSEVGVRPPTITKYAAVVRVRNVGEGAALFLSAWHQPVSKKFVLEDSILFEKPEGARDGRSESTELIKFESTPVAFFGFSPEDLTRRWLLVVDAIDQTNLRHQLQILRMPVSAEHSTVNVVMKHETPHERGRNKRSRAALARKSGA